MPRFSTPSKQRSSLDPSQKDSGQEVHHLAPPPYGIGFIDDQPLPQPEEQTKAAAADKGLPEPLKSGVEQLSGMPMDDVNVHRHSSRPAQLEANAMAQGRDIHLASGQEHYLPHEAWHVVQQKQGRVQPSAQWKGTAINDDVTLEREADVMGEKAARMEGAFHSVRAEGATQNPVAVAQLGGHEKKKKKGASDIALKETEESSPYVYLEESEEELSYDTSDDSEVYYDLGNEEEATSTSTTTTTSTKRGRNQYQKLKKTDDAEVERHKSFGKKIIATNRLLEDAIKAINTKKNTDALKNSVLTLAQIGFKIGTMIYGIPSPIDDVGEGLTNEGYEKLSKKIVDKSLSSQETQKMNSNLDRKIQDTTTKGVIKGKVYDKIGTPEKILQTGKDLIPFFRQTERLAKSAEQAIKSKDEWNSIKAEIIYSIKIILMEINEDIPKVCNDLNDLEIVTANKKNPFRHKRRMLKDVLEKYTNRYYEFKQAIDLWERKHSEHVKLLGGDLENLSQDE